MSERPPASSLLYSLLPTEIAGFSSHAELTLNLHWSWNHGVDGVWKQLDHALWDLTSNPWIVLQTVSREKLRLLLGNRTFEEEVDALAQVEERASSSSLWFQRNYPQPALAGVAYFSIHKCAANRPSALPPHLWQVFQVHVYLNDLGPNAVRSEPYTTSLNGSETVPREMMHVRLSTGAANTYGYRVEAAVTPPASDRTPRAIPEHDAIVVPLEASQIQWQR
jgi:hypothetical protein